jgi:hypothetical protein
LRRWSSSSIILRKWVTKNLIVTHTLPAATFASTEAWDFTTASQAFTNGNWTFGEVFVPEVNITVDFLGYYAPNGLGNFLSDHPVGMFDTNGNLLASTDINNSSVSSVGHFAFNAVTPIVLLAGHTYVVEGVSNADNYTWNDVGFSVFAPVTVLGNNWVFNGGLTFNGTGLINDVTDGYWGPDFGFSGTVVPEPGSLMLLGSGIVGLAGVLRRKLTF